MALKLRWVNDDERDRVAETRLRCYASGTKDLDRYREMILTKAEREELYDVMTRFNYKLYRIEEDDTTAFIAVNDKPLSREDMNRFKHFDILAKPEHRSA